MVVKNGDEYQDENLLVCPTVNQDLLAASYLRFKQEGLLDYLYYENQPTLIDYFKVMLAPGSICLAAFRIEQYLPNKPVTLTGLAHLQPPVGIGGGYQKSDMQFAFYREFQDGVWTRSAAKLMLDWTFDRTTLESVWGYTSVNNRAMVRFAKSLGYRQVVLESYSTWKGELCDVVCSSMTRKAWESLSI